ncbi:hypothetical protein AMK11_16550 [Streptomyces sp. CB02414]|nr:hypothetical protein AMK11_16550 [Streptomyces sp. CB02414]
MAGSLVGDQGTAVFFAVWTCSVAGWLCCRAAQLLTEMAGSPDMRPQARSGRTTTGSAFALGALPLAGALYAAAEWVSH